MRRNGSKLKIVLRVLRDAAEKSQTQLGINIHLDKNTVSRIENGSEIHPGVLLDWVGACGGIQKVDWLIDGLQSLKQLVNSLSGDYVAYA